MNNNFKFEINSDTDSIDFIKKGLNEYNKKFSESDNHKELNIVVKENGKAIGGLIGGTYWNWFYIDTFWIVEECRGKGLGAKILNMAESEAVKRGCSNVHLDTHDFQAVGFYEKYGYEIKGKLEDLPSGYNRYLMSKKLV